MNKEKIVTKCFLCVGISAGHCYYCYYKGACTVMHEIYIDAEHQFYENHLSRYIIIILCSPNTVNHKPLQKRRVKHVVWHHIQL